MKFLKICIICVLIALFLISCETKTNNNDSAIYNLMYQYKFIQKDIPTTYEEVYELSWADEVFLTKKEDKMVINDNTGVPVHGGNLIKSFTVSDDSKGYGDIGNIIACSYGEVSGFLYYISPTDFYEINTNANSFYMLNNDRSIIYCVYSIWYPDIDFSPGNITRIKKIDDKWQKDESFEIDLNDCIEAFYVEDNTVYLVTTNGIVRIKDNKIDEVLIEDAFWSGMLYPNSIIKIDDVLYIGMRGGIASYNLDTGDLLWYEQVVENN